MVGAVEGIVAAVVLVMLLVVLVPLVVVAALLARYLGLWRNLQYAGRAMGVRWWDAVGPLVLATGLLLLVWLVGTVPGEGESGRIPFMFSAAFVVVGAVGATMVLGNLDEYRQLRPDAATAGGVDTGPTLLTGTAEVHSDRLQGPVSGEPAVWYSMRITELRGWGYRKAHTERHYERSDATFTLDDGTGSVVVDPTDGAVRFEKRETNPDTRRVFPVEDRTEQDTLEGIAERAEVTPDDGTRFDELRIEPGETVTVLGTVTHDGGYARVADGDRRLVVFDSDLDNTRGRVGRHLRYGAALAGFGLVVGTVGTLVTAGVV